MAALLLQSIEVRANLAICLIKQNRSVGKLIIGDDKLACINGLRVMQLLQIGGDDHGGKTLSKACREIQGAWRAIAKE